MILHLMFRSVHSLLVVVLEVSQSALKVQIQQAFETWQPAAQNASTQNTRMAQLGAMGATVV